MKKLLEIKKELVGNSVTTGAYTMEEVEYAYFYDDKKNEVIKIKVKEVKS